MFASVQGFRVKDTHRPIVHDRRTVFDVIASNQMQLCTVAAELLLLASLPMHQVYDLNFT